MTDRRRYLLLRRYGPLLALLKLALAALAIYGAHIGLDYVMMRSRLEVEALKSRQRPDMYLGANSVKMNVIDDQGRLAMEITGKSVTLSSDQRNATFKEAVAKHFENGQTSLTIEAGQIEYDTVTEDFHITRGDSANALKITTYDGWTVTSDEVDWRRFKDASRLASGQRPPSFRFPKGVSIESREGNRISASYMQADKDLQYMEFVGNFSGSIKSLRDTQFLTQRQLTDPNNLKLEDFDELKISAEQVIYDKRNQVVLATSRFYNRPFRIMDFEGQAVNVADYQPQPQQVLFAKPEARIAADHLEAHIGRKWAESFGNISMVLPPDNTVKHGEDKALHELKQFETKITAGDIEYFWGRDFVLTHDRTLVVQADRRAEADRITYWGDKKMVLLEGGINLVQGSGEWLTKANLIDIKDADQARMTKGYTEVTSDKAVVYLANNDVVAEGAVMIRQDNREIAADQIVYQDGIKRLTAKGNVKFRDVDGQSFVSSGLVYHNEAEYVQMEGGTAATIRLPARYANDINRSIAESREQPVPAEAVDPPVPDEPTRNPNEGVNIDVPVIADAGGPPPVGGFIPDTAGSGGPPPITGGPRGDLGVGPVAPGAPAGAPAPLSGPREFTLNMGGDGRQPQITPGTPAPVPAQPVSPPAVLPAPAQASSAKVTPQQQPQAAGDSNVAEGGKPTKYQRGKDRRGKR